MSIIPATLKVADPYARTFYNVSISVGRSFEIARDFQNLEVFFSQTPDLIKYLENPIISPANKKEILEKTLTSQVDKNTMKFLVILVERNRINLIRTIIFSFLQLIYSSSTIKLFKISSASPFTSKQLNQLTNKLKKLTNTSEIQLVMSIDTSLIGGFTIETNSKIIDLSIKNQLKNLANHLDSVLEI